MFKILGGDGKEYGPVSEDTLRQWIREGRANAQTQVQPEGGAGWVALGQLSEFASAFATPAVAAAPIMSSAPGDAVQMVSGPAIGLIVTAGLGALAQILGLLSNVLGLGMGLNGGQQHEVPAWANAMSGGLGIVSSIIGLAMAVVILLGALKMKNLQSYGFAMAAAIIAMVPCVSPCCLVGLPIGIWALVVLNKPEVKSAFQR